LIVSGGRLKFQPGSRQVRLISDHTTDQYRKWIYYWRLSLKNPERKDFDDQPSYIYDEWRESRHYDFQSLCFDAMSVRDDVVG
jgi:hypothetical protein